MHTSQTGSAPCNSKQAAGDVRVARTDAGSIIRIEGRGTMRQSPTVREFACRLLGAEGGVVELDLNACTYLDSTFLGCLLDLHKRFGVIRPPRFQVAVTPAEARKLFGPTRLERFLNIAPTCAPVTGTWHSLPTNAANAGEVARHVMECHRALAQIEGPNQAVFAQIADQMAREMGGEMLNTEC